MKAVFIENKNSEAKGYQGEKVLFDSIKKYFNDRECIAKHGYLMNFSGNKFTIEADAILFDKELGINIFEVKGIKIDNILSISTDGWDCQGIYISKISPVYQVDRNASNLIDFLKNCNRYYIGIGVKAIIVLPYITSEEWKMEGFNNYAFLPPIIFKDDLENKELFFEKLYRIPYKCTAKGQIKDEEFDNVKETLFGDIEEELTPHKIISEEDFLRQLL